MLPVDQAGGNVELPPTAHCGDTPVDSGPLPHAVRVGWRIGDYATLATSFLRMSDVPAAFSIEQGNAVDAPIPKAIALIHAVGLLKGWP